MPGSYNVAKGVAIPLNAIVQPQMVPVHVYIGDFFGPHLQQEAQDIQLNMAERKASFSQKTVH